MPLTTEVTASVTWDQALEAITKMSQQGTADDFAAYDEKRLEEAVARIHEKVEQAGMARYQASLGGPKKRTRG